MKTLPGYLKRVQVLSGKNLRREKLHWTSRDSGVDDAPSA